MPGLCLLECPDYFRYSRAMIPFVDASLAGQPGLFSLFSLSRVFG